MRVKLRKPETTVMGHVIFPSPAGTPKWPYRCILCGRYGEIENLKNPESIIVPCTPQEDSPVERLPTRFKSLPPVEQR